MLIEIRCPRCRTALEVAEECQGQKVLCGACRLAFVVEDGRTTTAPGPLAAESPAAVPLPADGIQGAHRPVPPPPTRRRAAADEPAPRPSVERRGARGARGLGTGAVLVAVTAAAAVAFAAGALAVWWALRPVPAAAVQADLAPVARVPPPAKAAEEAHAGAKPPPGPDLTVPLRYRWNGGGAFVYKVRVEADEADCRVVWEGNCTYTVTRNARRGVPAPAAARAETFTVTADGELSRKREPREGVPFPRGPEALMPMLPRPALPAEERDEVEMDASGRVLNKVGGAPLPLLLGDLSQLVIDPLPEPGQKAREVNDVCTLAESGDFGLGLPMGPRLGGFGPPGVPPPPRERPARPGPVGLPPAAYQANERTVTTRGAAAGDTAVVHKRYELKSEAVPGFPPRVQLTGEGPITFDVKAGMPKALEFKGVLTAATAHPPTRIPFTLTYRLLEGAERARAVEPPAP
jgi:hypothetical protein